MPVLTWLQLLAVAPTLVVLDRNAKVVRECDSAVVNDVGAFRHTSGKAVPRLIDLDYYPVDFGSHAAALKIDSGWDAGTPGCFKSLYGPDHKKLLNDFKRWATDKLRPLAIF